MQNRTSPLSHSLGVGLTGFTGLDAPGPGVSVARALRAGWKGKLTLTAFDEDRIMPGAWLPGLIDRLVPLPDAAQGDEVVLAALLGAHEGSPLDALIPGRNTEAATLARLEPPLKRAGIATLLPGLNSLGCLHVGQRMARLAGLEIPAVPSLVASTPDDVTALADQLGYPVFVKSQTGVSLIAYSSGAARSAAAGLKAHADRPVVLQRQIPGEKYNVALVSDSDGRCTGLAIRRSLTVNGEGRTVCGTTVEDTRIARFGHELLEKLQWRGPLELELIRLAGSKRLLLYDLHCRLPAWSMLCHWGGANLAVTLLRLLRGERNRTRTRARPGTMHLRGIDETAIHLDDLARLQRGLPVDGRRRPRRTTIPAALLRPLRVAVTGLSSFEAINPGLGVVRALRGAAGIDALYGLTYGTFDSGIYEEGLLDAAFRLPEDGSRQELMTRLGEIHERAPFDVLLPCLDGELPNFVALQPALKRLRVRMLLPSHRALQRRSKLALFSGRVPGAWDAFALPHSVIARSESQACAALDAIGTPAVVKGPVSHCIRVSHKNDARWAWRQFAAMGATNVIVQPQINGSSYAVSAVCDRRHAVLSIHTVKKLALCARGSTWSAVHVVQPELERAFAEFLRAIAWCGPVEGEFIRDPVSDRFYLIEVNPRFTGWIYYSAALGFNQPLTAVRAAVDEVVKPTSCERACVFIRSSKEIALRPSHLASLTTKGAVLHA